MTWMDIVCRRQMLLWCMSFLPAQGDCTYYVCEMANGRSGLDFSAQQEDRGFLFFFPPASTYMLGCPFAPDRIGFVIIMMDSLRWSVPTFNHG